MKLDPNASLPFTIGDQPQSKLSGNYINACVVDDGIQVTVSSYIDGEMKSWINFNKDQLDRLIGALVDARNKMK